MYRNRNLSLILNKMYKNTLKDYLSSRKPDTTIRVILILLATSVVTQLFYKLSHHLILYPSILNDPLSWYRVFTYVLYPNGIQNWFYNSFYLLTIGYVIENRTTKQSILGLITFSIIIGGLLYIIFNQKNELNVGLAGPVMISWGFIGAVITCGFQHWKNLNLYEKIVFILALIPLSNIVTEMEGLWLSQLLLVGLVAILTFILKIFPPLRVTLNGISAEDTEL